VVIHISVRDPEGLVDEIERCAATLPALMKATEKRRGHGRAYDRARDAIAALGRRIAGTVSLDGDAGPPGL